ncbi:MAG TPA: cytochrome c [Candidatus Binatia bacterium]|nr:cytochrome c [Candidatus Binatia bacterium]
MTARIAALARGVAAGAAAAALLAAAPVRAWSPAINYAVNCQGCHLADGRATPGLVPALAGVVASFAHVSAGRSYLMRLPNVASTSLSDRETADLLNWVVGRFGPPADAATVSRFTAEEVASARREPLVDVAGARRAAVDALAAISGTRTR